VHRFRRPTRDSFGRLDALSHVDDGEGAAREHARGHIVTVSDRANNNPSLGTRHSPASVQRQSRAVSRGVASETTLNNGFVSKAPKIPGNVRFRDRINFGDSEEPVERLDGERQPRHPSAVAVVLADGNVYDEQIDDDVEVRGTDDRGPDGALYHPYLPNEEEMLIRRMWGSREVADGGD